MVRKYLLCCLAFLFLYVCFVNAHAHKGYSTLLVCLSVCLFVCYQFPGFSHLYDKLYLPACSSLVFLGFQLTDFDKTGR